MSFGGRKAAAVLGKPIFEGLPEAKDQGFEKLLQSVYTTGETVKAYGVPVTLPRKGVVEQVYVDFVYEAYREQNHHISGMFAVAIEVTQQVEARKKVEDSEQRFQNLIGEASVGIVVLTGEDLQVSVVNGAYGQLINKTVAELLGRPLFDLISDGEQSFRPLLDKVRLTGEPVFLYDHPYIGFLESGDRIKLNFSGIKEYSFFYTSDHIFYNIEIVKFFKNDRGIYISLDPVDENEFISNDDKIIF